MVGHVRQGRKYWPTMAADGLLHIGDWVKDELPDLLWPVLVAAELGTAEAIRFVRWQEAVQGDLANHGDPKFIAECLDGRLTSLDRLVAQIPDAKATVKSQRAKTLVSLKLRWRRASQSQHSRAMNISLVSDVLYTTTDRSGWPSHRAVFVSPTVLCGLLQLTFTRRLSTNCFVSTGIFISTRAVSGICATQMVSISRTVRRGTYAFCDRNSRNP